MKKIFRLFSFAALAAVLLTSCGDDTDPAPTTDCASATFPTASGSAVVTFKNFTTTSGGFTVVNAAAGDFLSFAVQINKGNNRPQKLRVYQTECVNELGTLVNFSGQPGAEDGGNRIDLQNNDSQIRNVLYQVPTGSSTLYLNFEVDESGSKFTYARVKLNVSGSGIIDSWSNLTLGAQSNAAASRLSSSTGQVYKACDAAANIDYIDVTYAVSKTDGKSYLSSNPARFLAPISLTDKTASCGEDGTPATDGGKPTYFKASSADFDAATDATLGALTVSSSDPQYVQVTSVGQVFEFLTTNNRKGLVKVTAGTLNDATATVTVSVKVQR